MSRTRHHSRNWNSRSRYATDEMQAKARVYRGGMYGCKAASESPNHYSHTHDIVPSRLQDKKVLRRILRNELDADDTVMPYIGTRRQHEWYW